MRKGRSFTTSLADFAISDSSSRSSRCTSAPHTFHRFLREAIRIETLFGYIFLARSFLLVIKLLENEIDECQPIFKPKVVEPAGNKEEKMLNYEIGIALGCPITYIFTPLFLFFFLRCLNGRHSLGKSDVSTCRSAST